MRMWVGVLAGMLFAALPAGLHAQTQPTRQDSSAAVTTTGAKMAVAVQKDSTESSDPEDEDQYLHTPIVKTIARTMHLSLRAADNVFLALNFLILALGIGVPLGRILPRILRERKKKLNRSLETARRMTEDAGARLGAVEAQLAKLDQEIAAMRAGMEEELMRDEARVKSAMEEESARIVAGAEQEITAAAAHARRGLRQFAADLAIEQAARQLVLTAEKDKALIAEFVREAAQPKNGGRN
ncbi:MAG TPA: ATP synthase F0 subunit B [Terracidiphilus sp.]|nr:ATP synthase F0 subunit B [Terracidiphilus sp.]